MTNGDTSALWQLVPKSYHFDGYNELNCPNPSNSPLFDDSVIELGEHTLKIRICYTNTISLTFSSVCPDLFFFEPYALEMHQFAELLKKAINDNSDFITLDIKVLYFDRTENCINCISKNTACKHLLSKRPKTIMAAISFNPDDIRDALSTYYGITKKEIGGKTTMKNKKLFGLNFEFGVSKDPNIKSTMMGVSVRNPENGNWYIFDPATGTRKNMLGMKFGNFNVVLLPAQTVQVGELIKLDNKYHYVQAFNDNKTIRLIGAADGVVREIYPEESFLPGLSMFTKVMAFDLKTFSDPTTKQGFGNNILAAICLMQWSKGGNNSEFSLDNITDDSFNGLGECLPLLLASKDSNLGSLFTNPDGTPNIMTLMALGGGTGNSDSDDMMQMFIMSQLLGGSNPLETLTKSTAMTAAVSTAQQPTQTNVICDKCGTIFNDSDIAFCTKCGAKTHPIQTACKKCGTTLKDGAAFCHACGAKVAPNACPKCGKLLDDTDAFCSGCGTSLKSTGEATTPAVTKHVITSEAIADAIESEPSNT